MTICCVTVPIFTKFCAQGTQRVKRGGNFPYKIPLHVGMEVKKEQKQGRNNNTKINCCSFTKNLLCAMQDLLFYPQHFHVQLGHQGDRSPDVTADRMGDMASSVQSVSSIRQSKCLPIQQTLSKASKVTSTPKLLPGLTILYIF